MIRLNCDYLEGCHPAILQKLMETNMEQTVGYGEDPYCAKAAELIRQTFACPDSAVHFLVGGTQTNATVIDATLRPYEGVLSADTGHINVHETGAIEATGHKVLALPGTNGKITAAQVREAVALQANDEHVVKPGMVYISLSTELGTLYTLRELKELYAACQELHLPLFIDGARLGYALASSASDIKPADLAHLCDVFYIGGTKVGALFGEALVISNPAINRDFRYMIKRHGGMLAKGRLLGVQFKALFEDGLYFRLGEHAVAMADKIRATLNEMGVSYLIPGTTNQIFPIFSDAFLAELVKEFMFTEQERVSPTHRAIRFCTSWATTEENTDALCAKLKSLAGL